MSSHSKSTSKRPPHPSRLRGDSWLKATSSIPHLPPSSFIPRRERKKKRTKTSFGTWPWNLTFTAYNMKLFCSLGYQPEESSFLFNIGWLLTSWSVFRIPINPTDNHMLARTKSKIIWFATMPSPLCESHCPWQRQCTPNKWPFAVYQLLSWLLPKVIWYSCTRSFQSDRSLAKSSHPFSRYMMSQLALEFPLNGHQLVYGWQPSTIVTVTLIVRGVGGHLASCFLSLQGTLVSLCQYLYLSQLIGLDESFSPPPQSSTGLSQITWKLRLPQ